MSSPSHAADDGSLARSTGGAAARGAMLIALAVLIGLVLLWSALDDADTVIADSGDTSQDDGAAGDDADDGGATDDGGAAVDDGADDSTTPTNDVPSDTTIAPIPDEPAGEARDPAEVTVLVANGTGGRGVAGAVSDKLKTRGFISDAANALNTQMSVIYYDEGFAADARVVAETIGATPDIIQPVPAEGTIAVSSDAIDRAEAADIVVIIGTDDLIPTG